MEFNPKNVFKRLSNIGRPSCGTCLVNTKAKNWCNNAFVNLLQSTDTIYDKRQLCSEKQLAGATAMEENMNTTTVNSLFPMNKRM